MKTSSAIAAALALGIAVVLALPGRAAKPKPKEPKVVKAVRSTYHITQGGQPFGTEEVLQETFNNNKVVFECTMSLNQMEGVSLTQTTELCVAEETYFPRYYKMTKQIDQGGRILEHEVDIEMFANVAVHRTHVNEREETKRIVLPAGTAFLDLTLVHPYYQLLFWYDRGAGGRQTFQVMDPVVGRVDPFVFYATGMDTIQFDGEDLPVNVYKLESEKGGDIGILVDKEGRIVEAHRGIMGFSLQKWTEEEVEGTAE